MLELTNYDIRYYPKAVSPGFNKCPKWVLAKNIVSLLPRSRVWQTCTSAKMNLPHGWNNIQNCIFNHLFSIHYRSKGDIPELSSVKIQSFDNKKKRWN